MKTQDLGLAVALLCHENILQEMYLVDVTRPNKFEFVFELADDIESQARDYHDRKLDVDAYSYFDHMRLLKTRIHNYKSNNSTH